MKGLKTGGRRRGSLNRLTREVVEKLAKLDCDPIEGMANLAMDESNPPELRGKMFAELAQYIAPKRKAIEHALDPPGAVGGIVVHITGDDANL